MQSTAVTKKVIGRRLSILRRLRIWFKQSWLDYLRDQVKFEWAELERTKARIVALDTEIIRAGNDLSAFKLK